MKTYKNLYGRICTWETLEFAYRRARKGKRRYQPAADFEYAWESRLLRLQEELVAKSYRPGAYLTAAPPLVARAAKVGG